MSLPQPLQLAIEHLRAGRKQPAREVLIAYLRQQPRSDAGWYLLSFAVEDPAKKQECLNRALQVNPRNVRARRRLEQLTSGRPVTPSAPRPAPVAAASDEASGGGRSLAAKVVIGLAVVLVAALLVAAGAFVFTLFDQSMTNSRSAVTTSQAGTSVARATSGASVGLPPTWTPTASATVSATPTISPTPTETSTPTPVPPDPETLAEMELIQQEVADLRGLARTDAASSYLVTSTGVRPVLEASFRAGGGTESEVHDQARVLAALGLIKPTYDLYTNILNGLTDSLGGFYLPWSKELFVIGGRFAGVERWVYSHEYGHALVDEHFSVGDLDVYPLCQRTEDSCNAIQALIEGDATLVMAQWLGQYAGPQDYEDILNYTPPSRTLPDQFPPPYNLPDSSFPYEQGLAFVQFLYDRGNWAEVNQAYGRLPASTEQILHPQKYIADERPVPVAAADMEPVLGEGWRLLKQDTMGEWMTYLLLGYGADLASQIDLDDAERAAAGWSGDTYLVYYNDQEDQSVLAGRWLWESQPDADEFTQALSVVLDGRFRGGEVELSRGQCWEANEMVACVLTAGREILWLQASSVAQVESLYSAFPGFQ